MNPGFQRRKSLKKRGTVYNITDREEESNLEEKKIEHSNKETFTSNIFGD